MKFFTKKSKMPKDLTVKNYVESFFEPIRYSKESAEAKKAIIAALEPEFATLKQENENDAFKNFVSKYPDIESLLACVGIDGAKAKEWQEREQTVAFADFLAQFRSVKKWLWIIIALFVIATESVITAVLYSSTYAIPIIIFNVILLAVAVILSVKLKNKSGAKNTFSVDGFEKLEKLFDRYGRKSINWLMFLFLESFVAIFEIISLSVNSKAYEIAERFSSYLIVIAVVAFFFNLPYRQQL